MAMDTNIASAAAAYANTQRTAGVGGASDSKALGVPSLEEPGEDFSSFLKGVVREAAAIGYKSENMSLAAAAGKADINDVITAVAEAELTLRTVTNVRDKVLRAYQDIIKMPI